MPGPTHGSLENTTQSPTLLSRESELFSSLSENLWTAMKDHVKNDKAQIAFETVGAIALGAGIAALTKNPALLGEALAPTIGKALPIIGKVGIGAAGVDWGLKLGAPAFDVWKNPENLSADKQQLANNVGSGIIDYAAMGVGSGVGAMGTSRFLAAAEVTPKFESSNGAKTVADATQTAVEAPRVFEHPEQVTTQQEPKILDDVRNLYETSFPVEERQPTEDVQALIDKGRIRLDTTRDLDGKLRAYSFVSIHDENPNYQFAHLDFVATDPTLRSNGIGTLHLDRLNGALKSEHPKYVGMTLEMEDPKQPGLDPEDVSMRQFRSKFYERQGATNTLPGHTAPDGEYMPGYKILDFDKISNPNTWTAESDNQPAEWRAFVYRPEKYDPLRAALTFYRDESGYGLENSHPAVSEMLRLHGKTPTYLDAISQTRLVGSARPSLTALSNTGLLDSLRRRAS